MSWIVCGLTSIQAQAEQLVLAANGRNGLVTVDNVAWAHVLAGEKAGFENEIAGQVFNITNDEPVFMRDFMKALFEALDARPSFIVNILYCIPIGLCR